MGFYIEAESLTGARTSLWAKELREALELVSKLLREGAAVHIMEAFPERDAI